ncbi:adenylate cyclase associated C terminal-domain-containing protein [Suillus lakei]|nr:adenylate cyclase associated C terminal-domain-containing protein [Suillus lakei]
MSSSAQGLYSLATLIKRLEAITSRLEDVEDSRSAGHLKRQSTSTVTSAAVQAEVPRAVTAYDEIVDLLAKALATLRSVLLQVTACRKPDHKVFDKLNDIKESYCVLCEQDTQGFQRKVRPTFIGMVQVDVDFRDPRHAEWVPGIQMVFLDGMKRYVYGVPHHGLVWNSNGIPVLEPVSCPPPPPPPPPPPAGSAVLSSSTCRWVGCYVTKGLRKVDKSEMTHKNPAYELGKPVKPTPKPAKFALEGNKWIIEYQENESALEVADTDISQVVNLLLARTRLSLSRGKSMASNLVNCTKTSVLVESVVSSVSIMKSPSFTLQITGVAPTVQIDSTDSGQIYLSKQCLDVEITTAKCSAINVSLPVEGEEDGVFEEQAMPEMLKTVVHNGKLVTTIVEHAG